MTTNEEQVIRQLLQPIRDAWPKIHLELCEAMLAQYDPDRLGQILVAEFNKEVDLAKGELAPNIPKLGDKEIFKGRDYKSAELIAENLRMQRKFEDIKIRINAQNELIADQYEQIQNLTTKADQE